MPPVEGGGMEINMKFLTIYPACSEKEIAKDPFQIPYNLMRNYEIESTFACWNVLKSEIEKNVSGLKIKRLLHFTKNEEITILLYILVHARSIDWLNLYFLNYSRLIITKIYKILNPKGHVYIKMDAGGYLIDRLEIFDKLEKHLLDKVDIISCESKSMSRIFSKKLKRDVIYVPNGFSGQTVKKDLEVKKRNIFLSVGRLGTIQKNTEGLLEAFAQSSKFHDWNLHLVGTIEEKNICCRKFSSIIKEFYEKYPELKERVIFLGPIYDREVLKKEYDEAKVFLLPSKWEGSPIVIPEALSSGLHIIASNEVMLAKDLEKKGYAKTLPYWSTSSWANEIVNETKRDWKNVNYQAIVDYANKEYSWESSCEKLYTAMMEIEHEKKK